MTPEKQVLVAKAKQSLEAAQTLLDTDFPDYAASRAYYSMFYLVEAILLTKDLVFSSHSAVISAFGREFAKTKLVPPQFHQYLIKAQNLRTMGDYGGLNTVSKEEAEKQIENARQMLATIQEFLEREI